MIHFSYFAKKVLYLKTIISCDEFLKINKAVRNSTFSNKCKLLQRQTVQIKENELKLDLKPLLNQITQENFDSSTIG
jgi:hypothetical protein